MRVSAWLLCVSWLCTWAAYSPRCTCQDACPTESGLARRSKTRVKEHVRDNVRQQHTVHRHRPLRRKAFRVHAEETPPRIVHHPSDVVVKVGNPATLSCRVDGSPKPTIEWRHNGQPLETVNGDEHWQAMVLSEGSLFFLSVEGGGRGQSHEGVYTCVASNSAGKATSRNASLYIAVLKEEFVVEPTDVEVAVGEVAVLNCEPPSGHPEPNVMWKKDGRPINSSDHHYTELSGKLIIAPAEKNHSGAYVCVASNTEGVRESRAARLSVLAKPVLVLKPENVSVRTGESAHFYCRAKGDPPPSVVWSREQGSLPNGRYLVNPDQTLQIHYVTTQDAGKYVCTAVNDVGVVTASAQLLVEESASTKQKDLHKELSALRVALENVTIVAPGSNISQVQWKLQFLPAQPHYLDGFEVLYRSLLPASSEWAAKKVTPPGFQTQVGPLKRGYKYEFKVRPYGSNLYGRESNTRHLRVPEMVPSASPLAVSITVSHEQNNTVHLSWEPPPHETHNGIIQGYQVWCVDSEEQQAQNWTVNSGQHSLDISALKPGKRYWLTIAAVNGAGVGTQSDPHGFVINSHIGGPAESDSQRRDLSQVLALFQDPVLIGSIGALLWCILMVAAVCLFRRHSGTGLMPGQGKGRGLRRLADEDLIIKHRMAAPDSPWISGTWRPAFSQKYQDLWAQGQKHPGIRSTSLPVSSKKDPNGLDSVVPIVTDNCSVYGTFYVDLMGNGLKTFSSPGCRPKMPHSLPHQQGVETIQIFSQPVAKSSPLVSREALPWKQAIRPQPKMGVLRESREKIHTKQDLHAVNSVPILSTRNQACPSSFYKQRLSHIPPGRHGGNRVCGEAGVCPRLLHYSASVHLVDMLPPPPPMPTDNITDSHSQTSDEGSSRSTKLTMDTGSLQSMCPASGQREQPGLNSSNNNNNKRCPSHSQQSTASYSMSFDEEHSGTLTTQEATQYLELSPKPERYSVLPEQRPFLTSTFAPNLGFMHRPVHATRLEDDLASDEPEAPPVNLRRARLQSTPSSCYSEWDSSLWNTWSTATDDNMASARTSLISSVDSCYTSDSAHFAHLLAVAAETMSGASLSDFSPPASPLSAAMYPPFHAEGDSFGEPEHVPAWDWSMAWVEEMEAQYRAHYPGRSTKPFNT
ncbi:roundabout-like 4 isoform X1 [Solea senegalensis]|uniref:Roundabout-like 4 isoform X1 n=1 Tax=Solea senegalensis TaxID=28829 RepID=A0AAV6SH02_SOLSE|nr:roundabout homolog 1 isoform X1 [Solea senegalensis]KAG7516165.1 roundabout-like 4 isoform X1 [Solea senegalensis]